MKRGRKRKVEESPPVSPPSSPPPPSPDQEEDEDEFEEDDVDYTSMPETFMPIVYLTNGNVTNKIPPKKSSQMKDRVRELTAGVERSLSQLLVPTCTLPNFDDSLYNSNKRLKETESNLKSQLADKKFEITQQKKNLKETQEYLEAYQEKSEKVKKAHKSSHRGKLNPAIHKFGDDDALDKHEFSIRNQPPRPASTTMNTHIMDDSFERDDDEDDDVDDRELEEIKRKMAPKLAKIVNSQRSAAMAVERTSRMADSAGLFVVGPSNHF